MKINKNEVIIKATSSAQNRYITKSNITEKTIKKFWEEMKKAQN